MRDFVLFGGGGHAASLADLLVRAGHRVAAVVDPSAEGWPDVRVVREDDEGFALAREHGWAIALGVGGAGGFRQRVATTALERGLDVPPIVARSATVAGDAVLGPGTVVFEQAHVGPRSRLGAACVVNTGAIVEHDCEVGDGTFVGPGAVLSGGVVCGAAVLLGSQAATIPYTSIGDRTTVGAGSTVVDALGDDLRAVGTPARPIQGQE